jgi:hypothetical protein
MSRATTWGDLLHPGNAARFFARDPLPPLDPATSGFSAANAWWLAELSRLVYRHDVEEPATAVTPARTSFLEQAGLRQVAFFNAYDAGKGFIVESVRAPHFSALVFRGTEQDVGHYWRDLDTVTVAFPGGVGEVHRGFHTAFATVWADVERALAQLAGPVFYAGHSLGGAIATLAAARKPPRALYTFGSPRVGDAAFVASLDHVAVHRVVHGHDPVAAVPPEILGYRHAGELHHLARPRMAPSDLLHELNPLEGPPPPLDDHTLLHYTEGLADLIGR